MSKKVIRSKEVKFGTIKTKVTEIEDSETVIVMQYEGPDWLNSDVTKNIIIIDDQKTARAIRKALDRVFPEGR